MLARLPALKKFAHLIGFSVLAFLLALLAGNRRAMWPTLALGALSEFYQWAFGFGFGWDDVLDLVLDTASVMVGIAVWRILMKWWRKRAPMKAALQSREST
jgi:glycopeptide antibiotics resistance protein